MNLKKNFFKVIFTVNILLISTLVFAVPQKINSNFLGTWCDGVEAIEITKSHIIAMHGRGKILINVHELMVNTPNKVTGIFRYENNDRFTINTYELKNKKLYEYFYVEGKLISIEMYKCNL